MVQEEFVNTILDILSPISNILLQQRANDL